MRYQVRTSTGGEPAVVEAEKIEDRENMFVFLDADGKTTAMLNKSFVQSVVAISEGGE